ncbi:neuraminidase-like domain-containing protein [Streptomyces sp. NPDC053253]|uniref:neuraminidase-like domain-containing protein n=1 Tax=Streptomyces sp. NPDC053253 TaxID=3365699 RepID=UPI0037CF595A
MRAITPIASGSTGTPVTDIHAAFDRLDRGSGIPPEERAALQYGLATAAAVREFQEDLELPVLVAGEVDGLTATALNELLFASAQFGRVEGTLRTPDGNPVTGAAVEVADVDFLDPGEEPLGRTVSDVEGSYRLFYDPAHYARPGPGIDRTKSRVDLVVCVRDEAGGVLARSQPLIDLHRVERVDLTLPRAPAFLEEVSPADTPAAGPAPAAGAGGGPGPEPAAGPGPVVGAAAGGGLGPEPAAAPADAPPPGPDVGAGAGDTVVAGAGAAHTPGAGAVGPGPGIPPRPLSPPLVAHDRAPLLPLAPEPFRAEADGGTPVAAVAGPVVTDVQVRGRVFTDGRVPVPGLKVTATDVFLADELHLGEAVTDASGGYRIACDLTVSHQRGGRAPDLLVRALDEHGTVLVTGPLAFQAGADNQVDLAIPSSEFQRAVEHEQLAASLPAALAGSGLRMADLTETPERPQITYLANKTGWDARMVAMASLAERFAEGSEIPAPLYYALFRAGVPARPGVLGRLDRTTAESVWRAAVTERIVPAEFAERIPALVERFADEGVKQLLEQPLAPRGHGGATLDGLLSATGLDTAQKERFAQVYHEHRHDPDALWENVTSVFTAAAAPGEAPEEARRAAESLTADIRLAGKLALLTSSVPELVSRLRDRVEDRNPVSLVAQGLHRAENWQPLLAGLAVPGDVPGADEAERRGRYAEVLAGRLALSYPTATVAAMVGAGELAPAAAEPARTELRTFLTDHQGTFELGVHPVDGFVRDHGITLGADALAELRTLQRLYQISPSDSVMTALAGRGIDSAYAVVRHDERDFVARFAEDLGGEEQARLTYAKAHQVHHAVLNLAAGYRTARAAPAMRAVPAPLATAGAAAPVAGAAAPVAGAGPAGEADSADLETLFGGLDFCACSHCRSVLGPAAYLVDLLTFLDRAPSDTDGGENPLDVLLERRPDLAHTQLTCENTNTTLPYVDLVNEVLEHFVAAGFSLTGFEGSDIPAGTDPEAESVRLAAAPAPAPAPTDTAAYTALRDARHPLTLPFHRDLAEMRAHLGLAHVALDTALDVLRPGGDALDPPAGEPESAYALRDVLTERLGLSRQERRLLTDGSLPWHELLGADVDLTTETEAIAQLGSAKTLARRLGLTPTELADLLRCRFANPAVALLPALDRLGVAFADLNRLQRGEISTEDFTAQFLGGKDPAAFGGDIPGWILGHHDLIMSLITLTDPGARPGPGAGAGDGSDFDRLELRRALPDPAANRLTPADFRRLTRFVRLWRALGWTLEQTDAALVALFPVLPPAQAGESPAAARDRVDRGWAEVLLRLAHVRTAMGLLDVEPAELSALTACWAPLDTAGPRSLYHRLFLGPDGRPVPAFADDGYGNLPGTRDASLTAMAAQLQAATGLDAAGLAETFAAIGADEQTPLTLDTISAVFRRGWLSRRLGLAVADLDLLGDLSGIDPFAPLTDTEADPPRAADPPLVRFVELARHLDRAGLSPARLRLLLRHEDPSGLPLTVHADIRALAEDLHQDLVRIDAETTVAVEDPTGDLGRARLALVYGTEAADTFFGLLDSTTVFTTPYPQTYGELPREVGALAPGLSYDAFNGLLGHLGAVPAPVREAVREAFGGSSPLTAAVGTLYELSRADAEEFFTRYPDLRDAYTAYTDATGPRTERMHALLDGILPDLRDRLQRLHVHQRLAAECGITPAEIGPFLDDPALLGSAAGAGRSAIDDALALSRTGLTLTLTDEREITSGTTRSAAQFPPNAQVGRQAPGKESREEEAEDTSRSGYGAQVKDTAAAVARGDRHGYLSAPDNGLFSFTVRAAVPAAYTLAVDGSEIPLTADPDGDGTTWTSGPVALSAGPPAELHLTSSPDASPELGWGTRGRARETVPEAALRPAAELAAFIATWTRLTKILDLGKTLALSPAELRHFAGRPALAVDGGSWFQAVPVTAAGAQEHGPERERALFTAVDALAQYVSLRRDLGATGETLLSVLSDPAATGPDARPLRSRLLGWDEDALDAVLTRTGLTLQDLADVPQLRRVTAVFGLAATTRVSAVILLETLTNEPGPSQTATVRQALRAHYDESGWLEVLRPLNDPLRRARRDALTAYALHGLAGDPATRAVDTPDKLYEHTLIDVQMDPCMRTSRIKQAISTVQLFVDRALLNLEPRVSPGAIKAGQWEWMKRYRVWEANRSVFLYPENWLEPELRDDKSPQFRELESRLLEGDITDDAAGTAIGHYLEELAKVAKLDVRTVYVEERDTGPATGSADDVVHVVARGGGSRREHYYRQCAQGTWSPWERVGLDIAGDHLIMTVWNGRTLLFWLVLQEEPIAAEPALDRPLIEMRGRDVPTPPMVKTTATLYWSEYSSGRWQSPHTSDLAHPLKISWQDPPGGFDRENLFVFAVVDEQDQLRINVSHMTWSGGYAFVLANLHSPPTTDSGNLKFGPNPSGRRRYVSTWNGVSVDYDGPLNLDHTVLRQSGGLKALDDFQTMDNPYEAPFFLQNGRHVFCVRPQVSYVGIDVFDDLPVPVPVDPVPTGGRPFFSIARRLPEEDLVLPAHDLPRPAPDPLTGLVDATRVEALLAGDGRIRTVLDESRSLLFDGLPIGPAGSLDGAAPRPEGP